MAGGHASSRVDSSTMKFRPAVASGRRPASSTPSRPAPSGSSVPSTPSKQVNRPTGHGVPHSGVTSGSDTDPISSNQGAQSAATPRTVHSVRIAPGISRASSSQINSNPSLRVTTVSPASGSVAVTPQGQSRTILSSSARSEASDVGSSQNAQSSLSFVNPVPRPVFLPPPARLTTHPPRLDQGLLVPIIETSLLSPPATQVPTKDNYSVTIPSTSSAPRPITIGQTRHVTTSPLLTPPATQTPLSFPLDPTLGGPVTEPVLLSADLNEAEPSEPAPTALDAATVDEPENAQVAPVLIQGLDQMPPPPPLPLAEAPLDPAAPEAYNPSENESSVAPKKRRTRRTTKPLNEEQPTRKRRRKNPQAESNEQTEDDADEASSEKPKRKRGRKASGAGRKVTTLEDRINALEKHAVEAAEQGALHEPLDPTNATMASLCEADLPNGRLSSKFLEKGVAYVKHVEERRKRIMERTAERLKMLRASGLDPEDPRRPLPVKKPEPTPAPDPADDTPTAGPSTSNPVRELGASLSPSPEPEPAETFAESAAAPQIRFVNGEMVLDEESQFYDRTAAAQAQQDEDSMVIVDEADSTRFSNSASFAKREGARGSRWTADETELFYWCLSAFGEDYENIARYLGRTPGQCKNKTKAEDRKGNEKRITMAIKTRVPLGKYLSFIPSYLEEFGRITGRDFSGPPPEIRAPTVPPPAERQEEQQEAVMVGAKAKTTNSAPNTPRKKGKAPVRDGEEEIMTLEEYERDGKDD